MAASVEEIKAMLDPMTLDGIRDLLKATTDEATATVKKVVDGIIKDPKRTAKQKKKLVVDVVISLFTMGDDGTEKDKKNTKEQPVSSSSSSASSEEKSDPEEERIRNSKIYRKKERRERRNAAAGVVQPKKVVRPMSTSRARPSCPGPSHVLPEAASPSSSSSSSSSSMSVDRSPPPKPKVEAKRKRHPSSSDSDRTVVDSDRKPPPQKLQKVIAISDSDSDDDDEKTDDELTRKRAAANAAAEKKKVEKGKEESKDKVQEKKSYEDKKDKFKDNSGTSTKDKKDKSKEAKRDDKNRNRSDHKASVRDKERDRSKDTKRSEKDKSREREKHRDRDQDREKPRKDKEKDRDKEKQRSQDEQKKHREKEKTRNSDKDRSKVGSKDANDDQEHEKTRSTDVQIPTAVGPMGHGHDKQEEKDEPEVSEETAKTEKFLLNQAGVDEVKGDSSSHSKTDGAGGLAFVGEPHADQNQPVTSTTDETGKKQSSPLRAHPASESVSSSVKITSTQDQIPRIPDDDLMIVEEISAKTLEKISSELKKNEPQPQQDLKEVEAPEQIKKKDFATDPDFIKYQKKFNLKVFKIELHDVKKQDRYHWTEGDQVYRDWKKAEKDKRKQAQVQGHAQRHKFEKYGKSTVKKPSGEGLKRPTNEKLSFKDKRFEALHKKIPKKEKKFDILGIVAAGNSKPLWDWRIPKDQAATLTIKPAAALQPPQIGRVHYETKKDKESWNLTAEERAVLEAKKNPKPRRNEIPAAAGAPSPPPPRAPLPALRRAQPPPLPRATPPAPPSMPEIVWEGDDDVQMDNNDYGGDEDYPEEEKESAGGYSSDDSEPADAHIPIVQPKKGEFAVAVIDFMRAHPGEIPPPPSDDSTDDVKYVHRTAKWFRKLEHESYYQRAPSLPENQEEEFYMLMNDYDGESDDMSWSGNVSNPDGEDTDITNAVMDADQEDEYCGAALLNAKIRTGEGDTPDCFAPIFTLPRGCNYDKINFQATCNLCSEKLYNKRQLGVHLRGSTHRASILNLSLKLVDPDQKISVRFREEIQLEMSSKMGAESSKPIEKESRTKPKSSQKTDPEKKQAKDKDKSKPEKESKAKTESKEKDAKTDNNVKGSDKRPKDSRRSSSRGRKRSRSRSRSPAKRVKSSYRRRSRSRSRSADRQRRSRSGYRRKSRSRSRSPRNNRRKSDSHSHNLKVEEFLARNEKRSGHRPPPAANRSPKASNTSKRDEDLIFQEKLALQANGLWTEELEGRWKLMEDDKERLKKFVSVKRKALDEKPEEHPQYTQEWNRFWEKRYQELVDKGKDADKYDYTTEWKQVWNFIADRLITKEHDDKLIEARVKFGVDLASLKKLNVQTQVAPPPHPPPQPPNVGYGLNTGFNPHHMQPNPGPGFNCGPGMGMGSPINNGQFYPNNGPYQPPLVPMNPFNGMPMSGSMMQTSAGPCFVTAVPMVPPVQSNQPSNSTSAFGMSQQQQQHLEPPNPPPVGSGHVASTSMPAPPPAARSDVNYSPQAMSISSGGSANSATSKPVGVKDVLSQWNTMTGQNSSADKLPKQSTAGSGASSTSLPPYDYENVTVIGTLKSILELEDYLSFLAGPMKQYNDKAADREAYKKDSSFELLKDKEFVQLLFQARDKFFTSVKAGCGTQNVRRKLNEMVFMLNILLDSPQCQKFQPTGNQVSATESAETTPGPSVSVTPVAGSGNAQQANQTSADVQVIGAQQAIAKAVEGLTFAQKKSISQVTADSFTAQGRNRWSEAEFTKGVASVVRPISADIQLSRTSPETVMAKLQRKAALPPARTAPPRRVAPPQDNSYGQQIFHHHPRPQPYGGRPDYGRPPRGYVPHAAPYPGYLPPLPQQQGPRWARAPPAPVRGPYPPSADMYVPNPLARRGGGGGGGGRFMGNPADDEVQNPIDHEDLEKEEQPHSPTHTLEGCLASEEEVQPVTVNPPTPPPISEGEVEDYIDVPDHDHGPGPSQAPEVEDGEMADDMSHLPPAIRMLIMKEKEGIFETLPDVKEKRSRRRRKRKSEPEKKRKRRKKADKSTSEESLYDRREDRRTNRDERCSRDRNRHEKPRRRHTHDSRPRQHSEFESETEGRRRHGNSAKKSRRASAVEGVSANFWRQESREDEIFIERELVRRKPDAILDPDEIDPISDDEIPQAPHTPPMEVLPEAESISGDENVGEMTFDALSDSSQLEGDKGMLGSGGKPIRQPGPVEDGELISDEELQL